MNNKNNITNLSDMSTNEFVVYDKNNKLICIINPEMAKEKNLSQNQIHALKTSHQIKHNLFALAEKSKNEVEISMLADLVEALEFQQQLIWGFVPNKNLHRFFDFPGCICPKLDNEDRLGMETRIYNESCPVHKNKIK